MAPEDRLSSWKEIAAYLRRDVTTAQRWEKRERMPVHRHLHDKLGSVYAFRSELDDWTRRRNLSPPPEDVPVAPASGEPDPSPANDEPQPSFLERVTRNGPPPIDRRMDRGSGCGNSDVECAGWEGPG